MDYTVAIQYAQIFSLIFTDSTKNFSISSSFERGDSVVIFQLRTLCCHSKPVASPAVTWRLLQSTTQETAPRLTS